ncbi:hypothetical protein EJB05_27314, partial [Eragrostis curvula]
MATSSAPATHEEEHFDSLYSLDDIDLSYNSFEINISSEWHHSFRLRYAKFAACKMGPLFPSWLQWLDGIVWIDISSAGIDLSSNNLSGEVPEDIATLDALMHLNLSWNQVRGKIPNKIGALRSLESLDLSRNKRSGEIPASLPNLTFLEYLDLSYNNLTGKIPSGSQLDTLYTSKPSMYDGNNGLCGAPLRKNCSNPHASGHGHSERTEDGHGHETFWIGLGLGFTAGLWVVFCTLLFHKAWRLAYFGFFDKLNDMVYVFVAVTWAQLMRKKATAN